MATTSNLYAEKVFAEHPLGLWALDEPADYVSLINDLDRDMTMEWILKDSSGNPIVDAVTAYVDNFPS